MLIVFYCQCLEVRESNMAQRIYVKRFINLTVHTFEDSDKSRGGFISLTSVVKEYTLIFSYESLGRVLFVCYHSQGNYVLH